MCGSKVRSVTFKNGQVSQSSDPLFLALEQKIFRLLRGPIGEVRDRDGGGQRAFWKNRSWFIGFDLWRLTKNVSPTLPEITFILSHSLTVYKLDPFELTHLLLRCQPSQETHSIALFPKSNWDQPSHTKHKYECGKKRMDFAASKTSL